MPTPVNVARQCLTPEAAHALDEAVAVARRRGHGQTTSLHAVSALLSHQSSTLREACARGRNSAYSPRLQFKALELCLSVSLDRVASTQLADDPPVSNSLMAAIKRSQANQRRQPENYYLYHQLSQQSSISAVKVELQHLILSILDDPVVSRVFAEAGFRSSEIKLAILRPFPQLLRYSRSKAHHPLFLCNLTEYPDPGRRTRPDFPFLNDGDENSRRIGEVIGRNRGRNPLLVGVHAYDALESFVEALEKRKEAALPVELSGLSVISAENDVSKFITEDCDKGSVNSRFGEVGRLVEQSLGTGLLVNIGDLKAFVADNALADSVSHVVAELTRLLELHRGRVWLIGATASYGSYLKFVGRFPCIEKDWDLQLLPITSLRPSMGAQSYPRSRLMESFVPFGGFFSAPSDLKLPINCSYQSVARNLQDNEKFEQDAHAVLKGGSAASVAGQHQASLPSWLQMAPLGTNKGLDMKTKDVLLSAKVTGLQKKWDDKCQHLHHSQEANLFPTLVGFQSAEDKKDTHSNNTNISSNKTECKNDSFSSEDVQKISTSLSRIPPKAKNESSSSEVWEKPSKDEDLESGGFRSPCSLSNSSVVDGSRTSPTSTTSVTIGLGISSSPASNSPHKPPYQNQGLQRDISGCFSSSVDLVNGNLSNYNAQSSFCSSPNNHGQFDPSDVKMLFRALSERVDWQIDAASVISQRIAHRRSRSEKFFGASHRRDIWFNFVGPDRYGKNKIAFALAEVLYGSQEQFICVDLNSQDRMIHSDTTFDCQVVNGYDVKFRGMTVIDYVAGELCKKPLSVVFLENVDKADVVARTSLSQAISTGKFTDFRGRQVSTNNAIFVTTTKGCSILTSRKGPSNYSEEKILQAKGWPLQIRVECALEDSTISQNWIKEGTSNPHLLNKRKLIGVTEPPEQHEVSEMPKRANKTSSRYLDLNLPAEENAMQHTDDGSSENDCQSETSNSWLQKFLDQVDETVAFKPVDFDVLADKILNEIKISFHKFVDSECFLEIDSEVMEQLLAAAYLSDSYRAVENWVEQVLSRGFAEVQKRYSSNAITTVKLQTYEGVCLEQPAPKTYLPPSIVLK